MQPEIMACYGHQKENDQSKKTKCLERKTRQRIESCIGSEQRNKRAYISQRMKMQNTKYTMSRRNENIVTPRWRRLYNKGRNFLLILVSGPMLKITCSNKRANVDVERTSNVSKVTWGLNTSIREINMPRYIMQDPKIIQSYIFFCLFHPTAW